jgi:membrane protease YdiL (CAAX protease family)
MPVIMVIQVGIETAGSFAMIALGLGVGWSMGLVWPPLDGWDATTDRSKRMQRALVLAIAWGIILGGLFMAQAQLLDRAAENKIDVKLPPWWSCLIASVGAGIREEVWLRLGLMTFFAWVITKLERRIAPRAWAVWTGNVLASLAFGAMHLPQAFALLGGTPAIVAFVMIGNGVPGVVFGWLFWRKGLIAAMVCHTTFDVVTKVIIPLVMGGS